MEKGRVNPYLFIGILFSYTLQEMQEKLKIYLIFSVLSIDTFPHCTIK